MSPRLLGLRMLLRRVFNRPHNADYKVFTKRFDQVVDGSQLSVLVPNRFLSSRRVYDEAIEELDHAFAKERVAIAAAGVALSKSLSENLAPATSNKTLVTFLIDHSGSMRGVRMMSAILAVDCAVQSMSAAGIHTSILGYTTSAWRGGNSHIAWTYAGRPRNPGRVSDLRHIVYQEPEVSPTVPYSLRYALVPEVLKENIDGEAIEWAIARQKDGGWARHVVCVICDDCAVDDSTMIANRDNHYLARHQVAVEAAVKERDDVALAFLFLSDQLYWEPETAEIAQDPLGVGLGVIELLRRSLITDQ